MGAVTSFSAIFLALFYVAVGAALFKPVISATIAMFTQNGWFVVLAILIFSLGEMSFFSKILEYIARVSPKDKSALYMGSQFFPMAPGNFFAGFLSGGIYERLTDKHYLLTKEVSKW